MAKFIRSGALLDIHTTYVADSAMPVILESYHSSAIIVFDWVFVRKYVYLEPTLGDWENQENNTKILEHYLRMEDTTDEYLYYYLNNSVSRDNGVTVEARARLVTDLVGIYGPLGIYIQDGTHCFIVSIGSDFVKVDYNHLEKFTWTDGGTFDALLWHTYRLTAKEGILHVFVDGSPIGGPWTTQRTDYFNHIRFGCLWSRTYQGIIDWDYVYVAQNEEIAPPAIPTWDITLHMDDYPTNDGWSSVIGVGNKVSLDSSVTTLYNHIVVNGDEDFEVLAGTVSVEWYADYDTQEHPIFYSVSYSTDEGTTWVPLALNLTTIHFEWNTTTVVDGSSYLIKVIANCSEGVLFEVVSVHPFIIDNNPPEIGLYQILNNSVISSSDLIKFSINDYTLSDVWYNWDETANYILNSSWTFYQVPIQPLDGYHWFHVYANDIFGRQSVRHYQFYVNNPPFVEVQTPQNNSIIFPTTTVEFNVSDLSLINVWYQWDFLGNNSLTSPFIVPIINSTGYHTLSISARDSYNHITFKRYTFYILGLATIETNKHPPSIAYSKESFIYSFTITNPETVALNLKLLVIGSEDDILSGNNSYFNLNPGESRFIELEIKPNHASTHQLEIYFIYEDLVYYHEILIFSVAPQWMAPSFLIQLLIIFLLLTFLITLSGISLIYVRKQYVVNRLFWEQHAQLNQLIDQLTISSLEMSVAKKIDLDSSSESSIRPFGFPQYLHRSDPLDHETLEQQFQVLQDQIVNGDPNNFSKLEKLLTQAESLLKEIHETDE